MTVVNPVTIQVSRDTSPAGVRRDSPPRPCAEGAALRLPVSVDAIPTATR